MQNFPIAARADRITPARAGAAGRARERVLRNKLGIAPVAGEAVGRWQ